MVAEVVRGDLLHTLLLLPLDDAVVGNLLVPNLKDQQRNLVYMDEWEHVNFRGSVDAPLILVHL